MTNASTAQEPGSRSPVLPVAYVLAAIASVQIGGALAAQLIPQMGARGTVCLRLVLGAAILWAVVRPKVRGHSRSDWLTVGLFGATLAGMNFAFYSSLATLPMGVAVTVEFLGPLLLAAVLSRRAVDILPVLAAGAGVAIMSLVSHGPGGMRLDPQGLALAGVAGACWAAYIVLSQRTGARFPRLDGLALAMIGAAILVLPLGANTLPQLTSEQLLKGLAIAVLSSVLPYSLELLALRHLSQRVFGVLLSLEPAMAALAALVILGQNLSGWQLLGMALVVVASAVVLSRPQQPPALPGETP